MKKAQVRILEVVQQKEVMNKTKLEIGAYYIGLFTREDAEIQARWNGKQFVFWNYSFGWYLDTVDDEENCGRFACFIPRKKLLLDEVTKEIEII